MKIEILSTGMATSLQDLGRFGYRAYGVPTSGAMDKESFQLANLLLGNDINAPCLEMTFMGGAFKFFEDTRIAITGANMNPTNSNGQPIPMWQTVCISAGDTLTFNTAFSGMRTYLAFEGGIEADLIMGSASTYARASIYPLFGRALKKGDIFNCKGSCHVKLLRVPVFKRPIYTSEYLIRVILGPHDDAFTEDGIKTFLSSTYTVSKDSDRMGIRLTGPSITHKDKADILSDGIVSGAIQVPKNGEPIVLLSDAQTTGGYTKIAHAITKDLSLLAQVRPGDKVIFQLCTLEEAQNSLKNLKLNLMDQVRAYDAKSPRYFNISVGGRPFNIAVEEVENDFTEKGSSKT